MHFIKTTLSFLLIIFSISCSQNHDRKENFLYVNIDNIETIDVALSELVESFEIIKLETIQEALFNWANGIAISDDYIMIADGTPITAKVFTRSGKFVRGLGQIGKGPGEYNTVVSPHIAQTEPFYWLLVGGNYSHAKEGWIYQFDSVGKFINEIDANTLTSQGERSVRRVLVHRDNIYFPGGWKSESLLKWKSLSSEKVYQIQNSIPEDFATYSYPTYKIYPRGNEIILKAGLADTIYKINTEEQTITPLAVISTKNHRIDEDIITTIWNSPVSGRYERMTKATEGCYSITLLGETKDYYLLNVAIIGKNFESKLCRVNRKNGKAEFYNLNNDFLGNLPMTEPSYFYRNEYLIYNFSAIDLKDHIAESIKNKSVSPDGIEKLEQLNSEIGEEDNNVLFVCRLNI